MKKLCVIMCVLILCPVFLISCNKTEKVFPLYNKHLFLEATSAEVSVIYSNGVPKEVVVTDKAEKDASSGYNGYEYINSSFSSDYLIELFVDYEDRFADEYEIKGVILTYTEGEFYDSCLELLLSERTTGKLFYTFGMNKREVKDFPYVDDFYSADEGQRLYEEYWQSHKFEKGYYSFGEDFVPVNED